MDNKRIKLIFPNISSGIWKRIVVNFEKNFSLDDFVVKNQESIIIIKEDKFDEAKKIIKSIDTNIGFITEDIKEKYRYVFYLKNLDCANCGAKVERLCKRNINCDFVVVDFATLKIIIESSVKYDSFDLRMKIQENAEVVDPRIEVKEQLVKETTQETTYKISKKKKIEFSIGICVFLFIFILKNILKFGFKIDNPILYIVIYIGYVPSYILLAKDILYTAYKNLLGGRIFDENFLMALATLVALLIGLYDEALFVIIFYSIGDFFQQYAVNYSRKSIAGLINIKPSKATIEIDGIKKDVNPESVVVGDVLFLSVGDRVPLDGIIIAGSATVDDKALTGESLTKSLTINDEIYSGSIIIDGTIKVSVTSTYENSMVVKILDMVENASSLKAKSENFISKFAKYYTPTIVILALIIAITLPFIGRNYDLTWSGGFKPAMRVAMIFMVISCPCALVISIPLGFFGGIGATSQNGILVKGSNYIESLSKADIFIFDKTGTLTKGNFIVDKVVSTSDYSEEDILRYAAYAEVYSNHVIAMSLKKAYGKLIDTSVVESVAISDKRGIVSIVEGKEVIIGRSSFIENFKIKVNHVHNNDLCVVIDKKIAGYLIIKDEIRDETKTVINYLKQIGAKKIIMFTGDSDMVASQVSNELALTEYYSDMMPQDKVNALLEIKKNNPNSTICFIGDGINDAPVISTSDIGIAIGGIGNDATMQIADIVLANDDLKKLIIAIKIALKTKRVVIENIIFCLIIKLFFLILSPLNLSQVFNILLVYGAILSDVGVSLIAILNSLRVLKVDKK